MGAYGCRQFWLPKRVDFYWQKVLKNEPKKALCLGKAKYHYFIPFACKIRSYAFYFFWLQTAIKQVEYLQF